MRRLQSLAASITRTNAAVFRTTAITGVKPTVRSVTATAAR